MNWNIEHGKTIVAFFWKNQKLHYAGVCKGIGEYAGEYYEPERVDESLIKYDEDGEPTNIEDALVRDTRPEAEWRDMSGNGIGLTNAMVESGIGYIDEDGHYDSVYTTYLEDVEDSEEINAMMRDEITMSEELLWLFLDKAIDLPDEYIIESFVKMDGEDYAQLTEEDAHDLQMYAGCRPGEVSEEYTRYIVDFGERGRYACLK